MVAELSGDPTHDLAILGFNHTILDREHRHRDADGAGLARNWSHNRAHAFFSRAAWGPDTLGLYLSRLIVRTLLPAGAALTVAVDDTLFKKRGKKVHGAAWPGHQLPQVSQITRPANGSGSTPRIWIRPVIAPPGCGHAGQPA